MRKSTHSAYRPLASSLAKMPSAVAICAALAIASASTAGAATYYWDSDGVLTGNNINGAGLGGAGIWTTLSSGVPAATWFYPSPPSPEVPSNIIWPSDYPNADTAVFTGTGGDVTLDGAVFVNALQFNTGGYSIKNGGIAANSLVLTGVSPTIDVAASAGNVVMDTLVGGSDGLIKSGAGTLTLNLTGNTFTGDVLVQGGTLAFKGVAGSNDQTAFGPGPKTITLTNNATLSLIGTANADPNVAGGKGFVIGTGGGTINVVNSGVTFYLNDGVSNGSIQNQLQGSGTLTKTGAGVLNVGRDYSSTFSGNVILKGGRIDVAAANALGNVGTITVDATDAPARLNYNSTTAMAFSNDIILQNGGVLSIQGTSHNLPNNKTITIGPSTAGAARIRVDDASGETPSGTGRTFVLNGALKGSNTLEVTGSTATTRTAFAISNAASDFSGTIVIDKNVSVENFARWNGTTATNTGKTLGTATIKFQAIAGGSGSATDGQLDLRDAGTGNNQVFNYGNNVDMTSTGGTIMVGTNTSAPVASTGGRFVLGTLALGSGNTLTVNTTLGYSLEFSGATTLGGNATFAGSSDLTLTGGITGGANLTKTSTGRLTIGAPTGATYTGTTAINAGGIVFNSASAIGGTGASVTLANGTYIGANFVATQANLVDRLAANANTSVIALGQDTSANLNLSALSKARLGAIGNVTYTGTLTQAGTTTLLGGGGGTLVMPGTNVITGTRNLDVGTSGTPAGVVALDEAQDFTGSITLSGGQLLRIGGNASLGNTANVITANGGGIQFKDAASGYDIFATRTINFTGGFILDTNGYNYTPSVAIGGNAGGAGTGNFTKAGAGKLTLNTPVLYNGKTIITGGTLSIAADNILGAAPGSNTADQLQIQSGGTLEANGTFTIPVQRGVQLSNGGGTISVTEGNTLTLASNTSGNGQLTKEGAGTLLITADPNNNTGGFTINGGVLALQHSGSTDAHFVINNSGTLRVLTANDLGDAYNVTVNTGGVFDLRASDTIAQLLGSGIVRNDGTAATTLTVNSATNATFSGTLEDGSAALGFGKSNSNTVTFTGKNSNTGTMTISTGQIRVEGASARLNGGGLIAVGDNNGNDESLVLGLNTDVVTDVFDKLGDTTQLEFRGSTLATLNGPAVGSTAFTETMGNINFQDGVGTFVLNPAAGGQLQVNAGALTRTSGTATGVIRGTNLGGTGADSSRVMLTSTSAFVGSGGTGSLASIVPFVIGGTSATSAPNTFLRYDATNGLTPLKDADYAATIAGSTGRNVSVAGGETVSANTSINALRVTGGSTILSGARLGIDSGAILFTGDGSIDGTGTIDSGARQLIIHVAGDTTSLTGAVNANINAAAGLAVGDAGDIGHTIVLGGNNRVIGGVTVNGGTLRAGSATALGLPGEPLNDLILKAGNNAVGGALSSAFQLGGNDVSVLFNGADRLQGSTRIQNASEVPATLTVVTNVASASNDGVLEDGTGGGALSFVKLGTAQLTLEQTNTYTGSTQILGGTVQMNTANGRFSGTSGITIAGGGILNLNNTSTANQGDRLRDTAAITMHGGQIQFDNNQGAVNYSETAGALTIANGGNQIMTDFAASGQTSTLTFGSLNVAAGAALNFTNFATSGDVAIGESGSRNRVIFGTDPAVTNGIIKGNVYYTKNFNTATTFDTVDFAAYDFDTDGAGTADVENGIIVFANYNTGAETTWTNTSVVRPTATTTLTANRTVHALKLDAGFDLTVGAGQTLNVVSGGIIYNPNSTAASISSKIAGGKLTAGGTAAGELAIRVDSNLTAANLEISSEVADNGSGTVSVLKSGSDTLTLSGTNTFTGRTSIVEGALRISSDANLGTAPATATAGHLRLYGGTLEVADTMTLNANRGIELGGALPTINVTNGTLSYNGSFSVAGNAASMDLTVLGNAEFGGGVDSLPGGLNVASNMVAGLGTNVSNVKFAPTSGKLTIGANGTATTDINVGYRPFAPSNDTAGAATVGTLDLQGLTSFDAQVANVRLGVIGASGGSTATAKGELLLPATSTITAWNGVVIGDSPAAGNNGPQSLLSFGSGASTLKTTSLIAGGRKGNGLVSIANGGTLTLTGFAPNTADLFVAYNNQDNTGVTSSGVADFSGGTLVADLDEIVVGFKNGAGGGTGGANGSMTLGVANNNVVANQVRIGDYSGGSSGTVNGSLTIGGGSLVVKTDMSLGLYAGTGTGGVVGTLNIDGGSVRVEGNIATSNSANATSTVNLTGGTLDMTGGSINVDTFNAQTGVLGNVAEIYNGDGVTPAPLTKTGSGTLEIRGANAYTGGTVVNGGTLLLNGSLNGTLATAAGTTLAGSGSINGGVTLGDNSTLHIELDGLAAGTGYDQLRMTSTTGSVSLGSNVTLSLSLGFTPNTTTDTFYYILTRADNGTSYGNLFAGLAEGASIDLGNGVIGKLTYKANWTGNTATSSFTGGNDIAIAIPEPGTVTTLVGGIGALLGLGRFRRRQVRA
ncbi:autotransporter-associated beta strand repeat-containing protein [Verrucomicrobiota bacterium sgz303538]